MSRSNSNCGKMQGSVFESENEIQTSIATTHSLIVTVSRASAYPKNPAKMISQLTEASQTILGLTE